MNSTAALSIEVDGVAAVRSGDDDEVRRVAHEMRMDENTLKAAVGYLIQVEAAEADAKIAADPVIVRLSDVKVKPMRWLWPSRLALGKLSMIAGDPGLGKSFLTLDTAARVSNGAGWPDDRRPAKPGSVLLLSAEDDVEDTIAPRLMAAGADLSKIVAMRSVNRRDEETGATINSPVCVTDDVPAIRKAARKLGDCKLIVVDPITAYLGSVDSHKNAEVRAMLTLLSDMAAELGVAVVAVSHLNKGQGSSAIYRVTGSLAFAAAARAVWQVSRDEADKDRRLFTCVKNNLGTDTSGLAYRLADSGNSVPQVQWEAEPISVSADEALNGRTAERSALDEAAEFLKTALANGPRDAKELEQEADAHGLSWGGAVRRAKTRLGVKVYKTGKGWSWTL